MPVVRRKPIFDAVRKLRGGQPFTLDEVRLLDKAIDEALLPEPQYYPHRVSPAGIKLMHEFEGCRLTAYPDPGSRDGHPWTIGWGSTGPGIKKGVTWTQAQADARFEEDLAEFATQVEAAIGNAPTNQNQFDALVSLAYNIGINALKRSTVLREHKAGNYAKAAAAFSMWVKNDGKTMRGLVRRRAAEAALYLKEPQL